MYLIVMNKVLFTGVPKLNTITKFMLGKSHDDFINETEQRMKALVAEIEKMVTPCNGWRFVVQTTPANYQGTKCGGIDGYWVARASVVNGSSGNVEFVVTVNEEEWLQGKSRFPYTYNFRGAMGVTVDMLGYTRELLFDGKNIRFMLDQYISCRAHVPEGVGVDPCAWYSFTGPSDPWVEDETICQAEKADMMRYNNWKP